MMKIKGLYTPHRYVTLYKALGYNFAIVQEAKPLHGIRGITQGTAIRIVAGFQ
jgi:hypothetical protein